MKGTDEKKETPSIPPPPPAYLDLPDQDEVLLPEMNIAYLRHSLRSSHLFTEEELSEKREKLVGYLREAKMHYLYDEYHEELALPVVDVAELAQWKQDEQEEIKHLDNAVAYCEDALGNADVRDQLLRKAHYLCSLGAIDKSVEAYEVALGKTVGTSGKLHILLTLIRLGLFVSNTKMIQSNIVRSKQILEKGGDWERRNKLKVYEGLYLISERKFQEACDLLLGGISTFTATEVIDFETFIQYCIALALICQTRQNYKKMILNSPEVLQVTMSDSVLHAYRSSFYDGNYADGLKALLDVADRFKKDYYMYEHWPLYVRRVRIHIYVTFLEPFQNVKISYMARTFGVSDDFIEAEVSQMIGSGLIPCRIDLIDRIIYNHVTLEENLVMEKLLEEGENLISKMQKLSAVIYL